MSEGCAGDVSPESAYTPAFTRETEPARARIVKINCAEFEITPAPGTETPEVETPPAALGSGLRQFLADFDTDTRRITDNASLLRRPDAVTFDYLKAYSLGPVAIGDSSEGAYSYVWRVRVDNSEKKVYVCRENGASWGTEIELFEFASLGTVTECDLGFEQAGRAVVVLNIGSELHLYWFDPIAADFVLENLGSGRTGRLILDNPLDTSESDVLLFYVNDAVGKIQFRQQRDRYEDVYDTPVVDATEYHYIEEVFRATDNRVVFYYSIRNPTLGTYTIRRRESTLYPFILDHDELTAEIEVQSGLLEDIVIEHVLFDIDALDIDFAIQSGILTTPVILHTLFDKDSIDVEQLIQSAALVLVTITHTLYDIDAVDVEMEVRSGILLFCVIEHSLYDMDSLDVEQLVQSGSLVTV